MDVETPENDGKEVRRKKNGAEEQQRPMTKLENEESVGVVDWLRSLSSPGGDIMIKLHRVAPKIWNGKPIAGYIGRYDEFVDEDRLREEHGGGRYNLQVHTQNHNGGWQYLKGRTIEIAGNPKPIAPQADPEPVTVAASSDSDSAVRQAMSMSERMLVDERRRTEALLERGNGLDAQTIASLTKPYELQISQLNETIRGLQDQIRNAVEKAREPGPMERIAEKMVDDGNNRLNTLREQHHSELRMMRESHQAEMRSAEDRANRMLSDSTRSHDREIDNLKMNFEARIESLKAGQEAQLQALKSDRDRIREDLTVVRQELVELRAKKDVGIEDQLANLVKLKELFGAIGLGGDEEDGEGGSMWERMLAGVMQSPIAQGFAARLATGAEAAAMAQQQQMPPQVAMVPQEGAQPPPQGERPRKAKAPKVAPVIDPGDVANAVALIEQAILNDVEPAVFVQSVQAMIPPNILAAIREEGLDHFLESRVKLNENSPIQQQRGRNFLRKVWAILTGSET